MSHTFFAPQKNFKPTQQLFIGPAHYKEPAICLQKK